MTMAAGANNDTGILRMIRGEISVPDFRRWMGGEGLADEGHAMHCLLTECFGRELAPKPFRVILPTGRSTGILYGYGTAGADRLRETALICADPLQGRVIPCEKLDSKTMPQSWRKGLELGFEVRIRPVVRLQKDLSRVPNHRLRRFRTRSGEVCAPRPGKECDVFQWEAMTHPKGEMNRSREQVYSEWLSSQLTKLGGASLDLERTKLISFRRTRAYRKRRGFRYSEGPDAVIRGVITVTNSEAFTALLARGVGRHRAYGYGMLLLRPVGRIG